MFETLLKLLLRSDIEPSTRIPIVDNLFSFVSHKDHIDMALTWLEKGAIMSENGEEVFKLAAKHRYSIVKIVYADLSYTL